MPELPEVETVVRGLAPVLDGAAVRRVRVRRRDLRWPVPSGLERHLSGARITGVRRRAKFGLIDTDRGHTLIFHLGMSGRLRLDPSERLPHDHVELETDGHRIVFHDPRRFGSLHLVPTAEAARHPLLAGLGPEPLDPDFDGEALAQAARGRRVAIRALLLDQRAVAGIGNIYACEALFRAGIHPARAAGRIARPRFERLAHGLRAVLEAAIEAGGTSLRDHAAVDGALGWFQRALAVYGREGEACPACGHAIRRQRLHGRSAFFCPRCQR
ncbi:MAG: bifunctional DNA-formamidopyrimidine glycosylase/DNA-(apurinic or apyrimidinic site) lyase [Sphingomonadaceae bacterium]|uniref:bifunctional DNA-formamidopyrimidine glycosylase/DNA-(apurinic or apyrimidinic site) lyase n=1 Tax=Thermaurantiacus sp. TaxID=2820283 RepID=UPI00298F2064|nr:bifunctional DNA-formamidopyrimidine glycosylase/DNA-(apurinic or apyrimidinic site) lyase [Thermaurantiacus sp.]MCS6986897.1 bifunctional DNA-formamidopyrimidine glycosylase/DNA-(apurinic or apyrimidinic site) lyase [Sphingomonadaceae bacterium]MDW8415503.1 bifunctional DNA-formamidopyrimidine glycosylase/DNA-(apurinic or apyrimidinic site) lyase [Thermaurantiacus sp.]